MTEEGATQGPDRFENAWCKICEFFPHAVLLVKDGDYLLRYRTTDKIWALGAIRLYEKLAVNEEMIEQGKSREE